jgi:hypothetical protein
LYETKQLEKEPKKNIFYLKNFCLNKKKYQENISNSPLPLVATQTKFRSVIVGFFPSVILIPKKNANKIVEQKNIP